MKTSRPFAKALPRRSWASHPALPMKASKISEPGLLQPLPQAKVTADQRAAKKTWAGCAGDAAIEQSETGVPHFQPGPWKLMTCCHTPLNSINTPSVPHAKGVPLLSAVTPENPPPESGARQDQCRPSSVDPPTSHCAAAYARRPANMTTLGLPTLPSAQWA